MAWARRTIIALALLLACLSAWESRRANQRLDQAEVTRNEEGAARNKRWAASMKRYEANAAEDARQRAIQAQAILRLVEAAEKLERAVRVQ